MTPLGLGWSLFCGWDRPCHAVGKAGGWPWGMAVSGVTFRWRRVGCWLRGVSLHGLAVFALEKTNLVNLGDLLDDTGAVGVTDVACWMSGTSLFATPRDDDEASPQKTGATRRRFALLSTPATTSGSTASVFAEETLLFEDTLLVLPPLVVELGARFLRPPTGRSTLDMAGRFDRVLDPMDSRLRRLVGDMVDASAL